MLTVGRTVSIIADGLRTIYGEEAQAIVVFALRQCRERSDSEAEKVWSRVLQRIRTSEGAGYPRAGRDV